MPAKALPLIVVAVVATGIVIYNHREQIVDLYERGREKLAQSLHRFADTVGPRQREAPVGYSDYGRRQPSEDEISREEETEGFLQPYRSHRATGRAQNTPARYRRRYSAGGDDQISQNSQNSQALYDLPSGAIPLQQVVPTQTNVEDELPPPPLPPRRQSEVQQTEPAPSESGYGSEHTVMVSPPIKATKHQPSPLAQAPQQPLTASTPLEEEQREVPSHSTPFIPLAAVVVAGTAAGATAAVLAPEMSSPTKEFASTLSVAQSPPSIHSSSSHSESDIAQPNPFESTVSYMNTQEWINNTSSSSDDSRPPTPHVASEDGSVAGEIVDIPDVVSDFGTASDGEFDDAASWTELGSQTSENDY